MKTRNILLFTASVATMSSVLTADSENILSFEEMTPAITAATLAIPSVQNVNIVAPEIAPALKTAPVTVDFATPAPVENIVGAPALAPVSIAALSVNNISDDDAVASAVLIPSAIVADAPAVSGLGGADLVLALTVDAMQPLPELATASAAPFVEAAPLEIAAPAAVALPVATLALAEIAPTVDAATSSTFEPAIAAVAEAVAIAEVAPVSSPMASAPGTVILPDAPQYVFFDDAAAPAVAAQSTTMMADSSGVVTLEQAIAAALETSPEINQAIMNKEAIEFEREQAQGLYLPRVDIEASAGIRRIENPTRRTLGIEDDALYPLEAGISAEQTLVDFGRRRGELLRQAARTDGAALRVAERSENTALLVSRQYLDILLQQRIVAAADDNVTFHRNLVGDLGQGVQQGSISIADQQQAQERLQAALVRLTEAEEALINAQISLQTLTGLNVAGAAMPQSLKAAVSPSLGDAVSEARQNNPKVKEASADVDAAHAMVEKANGDLYPTIGVEARGRVGEDIDGFNGKTNDVQARVVMRWNIFDGGINRAKVQEMVRRSSEARFRLHEVGRFAEEDVRRAWNSMSTQRKIEDELETQSRVSDDLLLSYREQFNVGRRSLLDVLDAQNTRYNVQVRLETARFSEQFSEYQVLAATNKLLNSLGLSAPAAGVSDARGRFDYGPPAPAELQRRRYPR
jgi:outer membrane protein, adhesin transport system